MCFVSSTPFEKSSKCSNTESAPTIACPTGPTNSRSQPTRSSISSVQNVSTPATIWFFVRLEMNRPNAMNDPPISSKPTYDVTTGFQSGSPNQNSTTTDGTVTSSIAA